MAKNATDRGGVVRIPVDGDNLESNFMVPKAATGAVVLVNDAGWTRNNPAYTYLAHYFHDAGLATLLVDLLVEEEQQLWAQYRYNTWLQAPRIRKVSGGLATHTQAAGLPVGLFAAGWGGVPALVAAEEMNVAAIVVAGGRPDQVGPNLKLVQAPTLFLVGSEDKQRLTINQQAVIGIGRAQHRIGVIPEATDLMLENSALEETARRARGWFTHFLGGVKDPANDMTIEIR
jgi:dienelactone hydrolase